MGLERIELSLPYGKRIFLPLRLSPPSAPLTGCYVCGLDHTFDLWSIDQVGRTNYDLYGFLDRNALHYLRFGPEHPPVLDLPRNCHFTE